MIQWPRLNFDIKEFSIFYFLTFVQRPLASVLDVLVVVSTKKRRFQNFISQRLLNFVRFQCVVIIRYESKYINFNCFKLPTYLPMRLYTLWLRPKQKYLNGNGSIFQFKLLRIYEVMFEEQNNVGTKGNLKHKVDLVKPS